MFYTLYSCLQSSLFIKGASASEDAILSHQKKNNHERSLRHGRNKLEKIIQDGKTAEQEKKKLREETI